MKITPELIQDYATLLDNYNIAHKDDYGFIPFTTKAHNPSHPGNDATLNALLGFETKMAKTLQYKDARMMKTGAIYLLNNPAKRKTA